jgi:hypothetical protein
MGQENSVKNQQFHRNAKILREASLLRKGKRVGWRDSGGKKGLLNTITKKILLLPSFPKLKITNVL